MTPFGRSPWDDGRLDGVGPDQFGPGDDPPAIYHVEAAVLDTEGVQVEAGEEFRANFGTAARSEDYAIRRAEMFFQGHGFEVVSDYETDRVELDPSVPNLLDHVQDLNDDEDTDDISWI